MAQHSNRFAIYLLIGRVLSMVASFIMPLVLVRYMSQHDYGVFSQFFTLYSATYVIVAMGLHTSLFYFYPTAKKEDADKYVSNTLVLLLLLGMIAGGLMFIPWVRDILMGGSELGEYADLIIVSIMLATPMNVVSPLNTVREDKWGAMLLPGIVAFARIGTVVLCTLVYNDLHELFRGLMIFQIGILAIVVAYTLRRVNFGCSLSFAKRQIAYALPFGVAVALQLFSNYYDKFVCIKFLDPADYAIYAVAFLSIPGITQVYDSLCQVNIVNMTKSYRSGESYDIAPQYQNFVVKTLSFSTPIIFAVSIYAEEIMTFLYTEQYEMAAPYFRLYSLTFLTSMLGAGTILRSMGKTRLSLYAFVITCLIGLPTTYLLVKHLGTQGAIVGAMINMMLPRLIQMLMECNQLKISIGQFLPWKKLSIILLSACVLGAVLMVVKETFHFNIYVCMAESAIYVAVLYALYLRWNVFILGKEQLARLTKKR